MHRTTPKEPEPLSLAEQRYQAFSAVPIYFAALMWAVGAILRFAPNLAGEYERQTSILFVWVTAIFAADLVVRFILDRRKGTFLRRNLLLIICLFIPVLRVVLVVSSIRRVRRDRNSLAKMVGLYALYGVLFVVLIGGALVLSFEAGGKGLIQSYGDAVWWSLETVTTVGYGDFTPLTVQGRTIAALMMFTGAATVGALTAVMASRWISTPSAGDSTEATSATPASSAAVNADAPAAPAAASDPSVAAEIAALREQIAELTEAVQDLRRGTPRGE